MSSWARKFLKEKFTAVGWRQMPMGPARVAAQEQAEKVTAFAEAVDHLPVMSPDFIMPWFGDACPPGWELVTEFEGRFMLATTPVATDPTTQPGATGGTSAHVHTIDHGHTGSAANEAAHTHGITAAIDHTHTIANESDHTHTLDYDNVNIENAADDSLLMTEAVVTGPAGSHDHTGATGANGAHDHGAATGTGAAHTHAITIDDHAGNSGSTAHLPPYVKVLFCRRKV